MTETQNRNEAVISLWPEYAEAIVSGEKTVEFRRRIPLPDLSARLWIYATRPVKAVIGFAYLDGIVTGGVDELWRKYEREAFLSEARYRDYFEGTDKAIAFLLRDHHRIKPIDLEQMKAVRSNFLPPQGLTWLKEEEMRRLMTLVEME